MDTNAFRQVPLRARLARLAPVLPVLLACGVGMAAGLVLFGWWHDIQVLKSVQPQFITMKANTAAGFLLLVAALLFSHLRRFPTLTRWCTRLCAVCVVLLSIATLYEYLRGTNIGIDEWLVVDPDRSGRFPPGRFAPVTALNFIMLGCAVLLSSAERRRPSGPAQFMVFIAFLCAFQALLDYVVGDTFTFGQAFYTQMALNTAVLFIALCAAILLQQRRVGIMRVLLADSAGSFMARHLVAAAILAPPLVNWVALRGQRLGFFDHDFSVLMRIEGSVVLFMAVVWHTAMLMHLSDTGRRRSRRALEASRDLLRRSYEREAEARRMAERLCREAQEASRLKDEFLATMSHELRTPINVIQGFAELLVECPSEIASLQEASAAILRNARLQTRLIEDLLDVSRIVSGKLRLSKELVSVPSIIGAAVENAELAAKAKHIDLRVQACDDLGPVMGDPLRLQQVFWNLIANAIKFTPEHGRVHISTAVVDGSVQVVVEDSGQGIDPEFLPFVFDRFSQQDGSKTRRHGGLGIGLSIVRHIVELHGGTVKVASPGKDQGATFTLLIPLYRAPAQHLAAVAQPQAIVPMSSNLLSPVENVLRGVRILIVDDAPDVRLMVKQVLLHHGAKVSEAASAAEALRLMSKELPDVLLSDIGMPGEDGYGLIKRWRALEKKTGGHVPAAALTAFTREEERQRSLAAGFELHIDKPVKAADLVAHVVNLAHYRAGRDRPGDGAPQQKH